MDKVKAIALTETSMINAEVHSTIALVKKIDQVHIWLFESFKNEVESLKRGMIYAPRLEQWSEDMNSLITPVLEILGGRMKYL